MTYLTFVLVFLTAPSVFMLGALWHMGRNEARRILLPILYVSAFAVIYTTPWDNYLIYRNVWAYGSDRIIGTIGLVPIEEYMFMAVQPWFTGLTFTIIGVAMRRRGMIPRTDLLGRSAHIVVLAVLSALGAAGLISLIGGGESLIYLSLILAWACPVLAVLWVIGRRLIWSDFRALAAALAVSTGYLWAADAYALKEGIWEISERYTVGLGLGNLPLEEAVFFVVTNLLVLFGVTMLRK